MKKNIGLVCIAMLALGACQLEAQPRESAQPQEAASVLAELKAAGGGGGKVTCPKGQLAFPEVCNAFDDDCDGAMDEGACTDTCDAPW